MAGLQTISDLAALARAGFKMTDIKEIMASEQPKEEKPAEILPKEEVQPAPENSLPKEEKDANEPDYKKDANEPDYKKMFEEEQEKSKKLASDLEKAQKANITQPVKEEAKLSNQEQINKMYLNLL